MPRSDAYWQKVPLGLATTAAGIRFRRALGAGPLAHAYLVNLWGWCRQNNRRFVFAGELAAQHIADAADWRGSPVRFVRALQDAGFVVPKGHELVLTDPLVACKREWDALPSGTDPVHDPVPKSSRKGRKGNTKRTEPEHVEVVGSAQKAPETPVSERARTRETENKTEKETKTSEVQEPSSGKPDTGGQLPLGNTPSIVPPPDAEQVAITTVLVKWREVAGMPKAAIEGKPAAERRKRIAARMKEGWTVPRLLVVLTGLSRNDYLMGRDPRGKPGGYRDVETVFRDNSQCEKLEALGTGDVVPIADPPDPPSPPSAPVPSIHPPVVRAGPDDTPEQKAVYREAARNAPKPSFMTGAT